MSGLYLWRAWTANREWIADCGVVRASTTSEARGLGWLRLSGRHQHEVVEIDVELVRTGLMP